jgi:SAM-dependent methyltransferase
MADSKLPLDFDGATYLKLNPDVAKTSLDPGEHYLRHGIHENRTYSLEGLKLSRWKLSLMAESANAALEIAPFASPTIRGPNVKCADIMTKNELMERALQIGEDPNSVPNVDYLIDPANLPNSIQGSFDIVLSSHVIEHTPNLLGHLGQVGELLFEEGLYLLAVPDCRFCFDHFIAPSSIAGVISAWNEQRTSHTLQSVIEHRALTVHNDPKKHWDGLHGQKTLEPEQIQAAIDEYTTSKRNGKWIDVHAWQFTPESFTQIVTLSKQLGFHPFTIQEVSETTPGGSEFYVVMKKDT